MCEMLMQLMLTCNTGVAYHHFTCNWRNILRNWRNTSEQQKTFNCIYSSFLSYKIR